MRRELIAAALVLFSSPTVSAQSSDLAADAGLLLASAAERVHIRSRENGAFQLRGRFVMAPTLKAKEEGTYSLFWVSPEKWREEITIGNVHRVRVGETHHIWQTQQVAIELGVVHAVARMLDLHARLLTARSGEIRSVSSQRKEGRELKCVRTHFASRAETDICVDAESGLPVTEKIEAGERSHAYEYSDFARVEKKWFPRQVKLMVGRTTLLEFELDKADATAPSDESLFHQPAGSESWVNCEGAEPVQPAHLPAEKQKGPPSAQFGMAAVYGVIDVDGRVRNLQSLYTLSNRLADAYLRYLSEVRYEPATCGGRAIRSEQIFTVDMITGTPMNAAADTLAVLRLLLRLL
jgi:hypothetical protein